MARLRHPGIASARRTKASGCSTCGAWPASRDGPGTRIRQQPRIRREVVRRNQPVALAAQEQRRRRDAVQPVAQLRIVHVRLPRQQRERLAVAHHDRQLFVGQSSPGPCASARDRGTAASPARSAAGRRCRAHRVDRRARSSRRPVRPAPAGAPIPATWSPAPRRSSRRASSRSRPPERAPADRAVRDGHRRCRPPHRSSPAGSIGRIPDATARSADAAPTAVPRRDVQGRSRSRRAGTGSAGPARLRTHRVPRRQACARDTLPGSSRQARCDRDRGHAARPPAPSRAAHAPDDR